MTGRIGLLACGVLSALASGLITYAAVMARLDRALALRPPIAVVDYAPLGQRLGAGVPARELQPALTAMKATSSRLRQHGYLVLNRTAADAVPDDYLVPAALAAEAIAAPAPGAAGASSPAPAPPAAPAWPAPEAGPAIDPAEAASLIRSLTSPPGDAP